MNDKTEDDSKEYAESDQPADDGLVGSADTPVADEDGVPAAEDTAEPEMTTNEADQEPPTAADTPVAVATASDTSTSTPNDTKKRMIMGVAGAVILLIVAASTWLVLSSRQATSDNVESTLSTPVEQPKLGVALTVADGTVEYSTDGTIWQAASASTDFAEGNYVRTGSESRAVLTLDDGSAIRLDTSSTVQLSDLTADHIMIEHIAGMVYSRVVSNTERRYSITASDVEYEALGTAFMTINTSSKSGVQVFQSSVKTSATTEAITEGKQYFKSNQDGELAGKTTDIDIDVLVEDAFVNWNLSEDESDATFKTKLGILPKIKERLSEIEEEREAAEEAARLQAEKEAAALAEKERLAAEEKAAKEAQVERGQMALIQSGKTFEWTYTGKAVHGYKLVYSNKTTKPTFGEHSSIYFGDINSTSGSLPKNIDPKGIYFVRVCAYTAGTEDDACVDYSNFVSIAIW